MDKSQIREIIKSKKNTLTKDQIITYSNQITSKLVEQLEYKVSDTVFCYINFNQEVVTRELIEKSWNNNKRVAVPKVEDNKMEFYYITEWNNLEKGYYNIYEPTTDYKARLDCNTLMILPGLAFDIHRNRIGYGGGFYDRYLQNRKEISKIAIAYDFQIFDSIPYENTDIKPDKIITDKNIF